MVFGNLIKYDENKCDLCNRCVEACHDKLISIVNNKIFIDIDKCIGCKKCIQSCPKYSLLYYINTNDPNGEAGIIPADSNPQILPFKYNKIFNLELGEKIKTIEVSFALTQLLNNKLNGIVDKNYLIYSDILNIDDIINNNKDNNINSLKNKILNIDNEYNILIKYISKYENIEKIDLYGVEFNIIKELTSNKNVNIYNQYLNVNHKYNILDIINTFLRLNKFDNEVLNELLINNSKVLEFNNKNISVKFLIVNDINILSNMDSIPYDYVFIAEKEHYKANNNLLKDEEINNIYKKYLKTPLKSNIIYK